MKKILFVLMLSAMSFDAQALHPDFKLEKNKEELVGLYRKYLHTLPEGLDTLKGFKNLLKTVTLKKAIDLLDIELPLKQIKAIYSESGVVQFREIDPKSRTLVIGCGNKPLQRGGWETVVHDKIYGSIHAHPGAVTIDPDPRMNPTIVAFFGVKKLNILMDNSFDKVLIEAISIPGLLEIEGFIPELDRVLAKKGRLYNDFGGYGPVKIDISKLPELGRKWEEADARDELFGSKVMVARTLHLVPKLFKKMIKAKGRRQVEQLFRLFLREINWVHAGKTWGETFLTIGKKAKVHNSFFTQLKKFFGYPPPPFTEGESRLIRLAAMELNVS